MSDSNVVRFVDTTLRDGQQSLWAMRMRTGAMLPALGDLDVAGFDGIEFFVPSAQFRRTVRDLREDPWVWLRRGAAVARNTPLRLHGGGGSPFHPVPASIQLLLLEKLRDLGIAVTRVSEPWNNFARLEKKVQTFREYGIESVVNIIYSSSPRHTFDHYRDRVEAAVALDPYRVCFKDVGGLLTSEATRELIPMVMEQAGGYDVEFHAHCNSGLAPYCVGVAVESGVRVVHTALPPLANGSSLPSTFAVARNLAARGYRPAVDLAPLERASEHLQLVAADERLPVGMPAEFDQRLYHHAVPGGMISNLRFQLEEVGMEHRLDETLDETARVRAELGYPTMVTPLSQFVASQAAVNVMTGKRYESVTDEIIQYALGQWGSEAVELMDPGVRATVLDRRRATELAEAAARVDPDPPLADVRKRYGLSLSDEELLTRAYAGIGAEPLDVSSAEPPATYEEYLSARLSVKTLLDRLAATGTRSFTWRDDTTVIEIRR